MADKLYIGLDVGSDSVGWAATDEEYNLCRIKGKTAWGARLFDEASDANWYCGVGCALLPPAGYAPA